jgi:hypothetical protein
MDAELSATTTSREIAGNEDEEQFPDETAEDIHVLSNLLKSLGASEGSPGPVFSILKEMGVNPPKLRSNDLDESDNE